MEDECDEPFQENGIAEPNKDEPMPQVEVIEKGETVSGSRDSSVVVSDLFYVRFFGLLGLFVVLFVCLFV